MLPEYPSVCKTPDGAEPTFQSLSNWSVQSTSAIETYSLHGDDAVAGSQWSNHQEAILKRQNLEKLAGYRQSVTESLADPSTSTVCHDVPYSTSQESFDPLDFRQSMMYNVLNSNLSKITLFLHQTCLWWTTEYCHNIPAFSKRRMHPSDTTFPV